MEELEKNYWIGIFAWDHNIPGTQSPPHPGLQPLTTTPHSAPDKPSSSTTTTTHENFAKAVPTRSATYLHHPPKEEPIDKQYMILSKLTSSE